MRFPRESTVATSSRRRASAPVRPSRGRSTWRTSVVVCGLRRSTRQESRSRPGSTTYARRSSRTRSRTPSRVRDGEGRGHEREDDRAPLRSASRHSPRLAARTARGCAMNVDAEQNPAQGLREASRGAPLACVRLLRGRADCPSGARTRGEASGLSSDPDCSPATSTPCFRRVGAAGIRQCARMSFERREAAYGFGSTTFVTTQRCLPILRSRMNPNFSYVDKAPWKRKPAGTEPASSG